MNLHEELRPKDLREVIGQDKICRKIEHIRKRGFNGKSLWITGKTGQGKTTIARIIARMASMEYAISEVDGSDMSLEFVRNFERTMRSKPLGCDCHVLIVNESHRLSSAVVSRLLTTLESEGFKKNGLLILTTTSAGNVLFSDAFDSGPFASRCINLKLSEKNLAKPFADYCKLIGDREGCTSPIEAYRKLAKDCFSNLREMITRIEAGELLEA